MLFPGGSNADSRQELSAVQGLGPTETEGARRRIPGRWAMSPRNRGQKKTREPDAFARPVPCPLPVFRRNRITGSVDVIPIQIEHAGIREASTAQAVSEPEDVNSLKRLPHLSLRHLPRFGLAGGILRRRIQSAESGS
jgi:hypothetical protein